VNQIHLFPHLHGFLTLEAEGSAALQRVNCWYPSGARPSLSLVGLPANTMHDVFGRLVSGVLVLDAVAWTNDTNRAVGIAQHSIYGFDVKAGDEKRIWLGSFRTAAAGLVEDNLVNNGLWNRYNRVRRKLHREDGTSHTYSGSDRYWNNDSNQILRFLAPQQPSEAIRVTVGALISPGSASTGQVGFGIDASGMEGWWTFKNNNGGQEILNITAHRDLQVPSIGAHSLSLREQSSGSSITFSVGSLSADVWS
jgi:hypothetical protein